MISRGFCVNSHRKKTYSMNYLNLEQVRAVVLQGKPFSVAPEAMQEVERCYRFLEQFHQDKVIYGINTGFGPMAQWRVDDR